MLRAAIDTNVVFEGLTSLGEGGSIIDAWVAGRFTPCVSTALALEYEEVLSNKIGARRRETVLGALQALLDRVEFVPIFFRVRPASPDPDDDFLIECAANGQAHLVTRNTRDTKVAELAFGIRVYTPAEFLQRLAEQE